MTVDLRSLYVHMGVNMSDFIVSTDRQLREMLHRLQSEYDARHAAFERDISLLRQRIKGIEIALAPSLPEGGDDVRPVERVLPFQREREVTRPTTVPPPTSTRDLTRKIRGLTHPEALIMIAQENGGVLLTAPAKAIMLEAGLVRGNPKNALGHVFQLIKDSSRFEKFGYRFEKINPGEYRLLPAGFGVSTQDDSNAQEEPSLGTPASAPHPMGTDFITVDNPRTS